MAESVIWRVRTERIGSLASFKSEYDMEAFLMNNPALIGCWDPGDESRPPYLVRQQLSTRKGTGDRGRLDLVGLVIDEEEPTLKIFELKVGSITSESVKQLADYLQGWETQGSARQQVQSWLVEVGLEQPIREKLLGQPAGVLVGASFDPSAIADATRLGIEGIRLARFRSESEGGEYFVIIEDQVGKIVASARRVFSWKEIGLDGPSERLYIDIEGAKGQKTGQRILARPDPESLALKSKRLIFDKDSAALLLERTEQMLARSDPSTAWVKEEVQALNANHAHPVGISRATALVCFALSDRRKAWWVPGPWWVHERTGKTLSEIESDRKQG